MAANARHRRARAAASPSAAAPPPPPPPVPVHALGHGAAVPEAAGAAAEEEAGGQGGPPRLRGAAPAGIDRREEHRLPACPCCGGGLKRCNRTRTRIIEDIPEKIEPVVTEHTIHRD